MGQPESQVKLTARPFFRPISVRRHNRSTILRLLAQHSKHGDVVYDIGCGDQTFAPYLRAVGCSYIGVDIEGGFYQMPPDLVASAVDIPVADNVADMVVLSQVLEHLVDPVAALKEAHRLLRPGGILLCSFPFLYPVHAPPHDYGRYTRFFVAETAKRLGYSIRSEDVYAGYWRTCGESFAIYAQGSFSRGPLKVTGIVPLVTAIQQWFCVAMHYLEGATLLLAGKRPENLRQIWPLNYVFALTKE